MRNGVRAEKQRLRREIRPAAQSLTPEYRAEASRSITRQVLALPSWKKARTVMLYFSMPEEPDTAALAEAAFREGKAVLLPRCLDDRHMVALRVSDMSRLEPGALGIPEPVLTEAKPGAPEPDLILVPCVAATPGGIRLGHGAGYYDRFLAEHPAETVCLCFRALLRGDLPAEETDVPVDLVISD